MSIFKKSLKTFTSDILGEPIEFKINNAIWLLMETKFGLNQTQYVKGAEENENTYGAKFVTAVLLANGYKTTEKEVLDNTDPADIAKFSMVYNKVIMEKFKDVFEAGDEDGDDEGKL